VKDDLAAIGECVFVYLLGIYLVEELDLELLGGIILPDL
jgi:hypothetical protein